MVARVILCSAPHNLGSVAIVKRIEGTDLIWQGIPLKTDLSN